MARGLTSILLHHRWISTAQSIQMQAGLSTGDPLRAEESLETEGSPCKIGTTLAWLVREECLSVGVGLTERARLPT